MAIKKRLATPEVKKEIKDTCAKAYPEQARRAYRQSLYIWRMYGIGPKRFCKWDFFDVPRKQITRVFGNDISAKKYINVLMQETGWTGKKILDDICRAKDVHTVTVRAYYLTRQFAMTNEEIRKFYVDKNEEFEADCKRVMEETGWDIDQVKKDMKNRRKVFSIDREHYMVYGAWNLTDEKLSTYLTIADSRALSRKYNKKSSLLYNKKKFLDAYKQFIGRKYCYNRGLTFEEFEKFADDLDYMFTKALSSTRGRGMEKISLKDDHRKIYDDIMKREGRVLEEPIKQHHIIEALDPGRVASIRVVTILDNGVCHHVCTFINIGTKGISDHGGLMAGVDEKTGVIITPAVDVDGSITDDHPQTHQRITGLHIPNWDKVLEMTEAAARLHPENGYVGWDVAIRENDAVLIEGNSLPGLGALQSVYAYKQEGKKYIVEPFMDL